MALTLLKNGTKVAEVKLLSSPREAGGGRGRCVLGGPLGEVEKGASYALEDGEGRTLKVRADMTHESTGASDEPTMSVTFDWSKPFAWSTKAS